MGSLTRRRLISGVDSDLDWEGSRSWTTGGLSWFLFRLLLSFV